MKNIMKKAVICSVVLSMASLFALTNAHAEEGVKPISDTTGMVLYRYNTERDDFSIDHKRHNGIDILYDEYTFIKCPITGVVDACGTDSFGAWVVVTDKEKGDSVVFANLGDIFVKEGTPLKAGDALGVTGKEYVHFSYYPTGYKSNETTDPTAFLTMNGTKLNFEKAED